MQCRSRALRLTFSSPVRLRAMTAVWMGVTTVKKEVEARELDIQGDKAIASAMQEWLGLSPFAKEKSRLAA